MPDDFTEINRCQYLYLRELSEPSDNVLRLVIEEARAQEPPRDETIHGVALKDVRNIASDETSARFEFLWPSYVAYSVRNESYTTQDKSETWDGRLFRIYHKSHFLDYVAKATLANADYPGPLRHWGLACLNHDIDVIGCVEPGIRSLRD